MVLKRVYVVARNNTGRPTLQHRLLDHQTIHTACGLDMASWSRSYMDTAIEAILCKKDACRT